MPIVPKRRTSRSNTHSRRAQWKATPPTLVRCSNRACGKPTLPHRVCPSCGQYAGRVVTE